MKMQGKEEPGGKKGTLQAMEAAQAREARVVTQTRRGTPRAVSGTSR
jgi:hypothetical protein